VANVTPVMDGEQTVAYLSVRTEPTRAQIEAFEALFATMRAEQQAGLPGCTRLQHGAAAQTHLGRTNRPCAVSGRQCPDTTVTLLTGAVGTAGGVLAAGGPGGTVGNFFCRRHCGGAGREPVCGLAPARHDDQRCCACLILPTAWRR